MLTNNAMLVQYTVSKGAGALAEASAMARRRRLREMLVSLGGEYVDDSSYRFRPHSISAVELERRIEAILIPSDWYEIGEYRRVAGRSLGALLGAQLPPSELQGRRMSLAEALLGPPPYHWR